MMLINHLALILLLISCGKEVNISTSKLQSESGLQDGGYKSTYQTGTLIRSEKDQIKTSTNTYTVSPYSSHLVLTFISSKPKGSETQVKFRGKTSGNEIRMDLIE